MYYYYNQYELDETNHLPLNHISKIKLCQDNSNAWIGLKDGSILNINLQNKKSFRSLSSIQSIADLDLIDNYLLCLTKNSVQLFSVEQQSTSIYSQDDFTSETTCSSLMNKNFSSSFSNQKSNNQTSFESSPIECNFSSEIALNTFCKLNRTNQYLLGGCQSKLLLLDLNYMCIINEIPLNRSLLNSLSSCIKIKRVESKKMIIVASLGGQITIYDEINFKQIHAYKPFKISIFDFDIINNHYILSSGFNECYSSNSAKSVHIFDLNFNDGLALIDDTRFYKAQFIRGLPNSTFCFTLDKDAGIGEINQIHCLDSFKSNGQKISIELQCNSTINCCEISSNGELLLTSDKNGYLHIDSLKNNQIMHTDHIQINDLIHNSTFDTVNKYDFNQPKRDFKIKSLFFINPKLDDYKSNLMLKDLTLSRGFNRL